MVASLLSSNVASSARHVVVASKNRVKIDAVSAAVKLCFPRTPFVITGSDTESGVPSQPVGDDETLQGASNRLHNLRNSVALTSSTSQDAQGNTLLVAVEGGVGLRHHDKRMECFAWVAVGCTASDAISTARSASFLLPPALEELVQQGMELGAADDVLFKRQASGQGTGTVGRLSHGAVTRTSYYEHSVALAFIPFMNPELYGDEYSW